MPGRQRIQKAALLLTGVVIFLSYVNRAVFTHVHILGDGTVIVHAHPYLKHHSGKEDASSKPGHHHPAGLLHFPVQHILYYKPVKILRVSRPVASPVILPFFEERKERSAYSSIFFIRPPPCPGGNDPA